MMGHGFEENRILLQSELAKALPPVLAIAFSCSRSC